MQTVTTEPVVAPAPYLAPGAGAAARARWQDRGRLRGDLLWSMGALVTQAAGQWLILVLFARLADDAILGAFALALALTAPVDLLARMQLRQIVTGDSGARWSWRATRRVRSLATAVALVACGGIAWLYSDPVLRGFVLLVGVAKAIDSWADLTQAEWQSRGLYARAGRSTACRAVVPPLGVAAMLVWVDHPLAGAVALLLSTTLVLVAHDLPLRLRVDHTAGEPGSHRGEIRALLRFALPLGVAATLASLKLTVPRLFVEHQIDIAAVGRFTAIAASTVVAGRLLYALTQVYLPRVGHAFANRDVQQLERHLRTLWRVTLLLGVAVVAGSVVVGAEALTLVYGAAYAPMHLLLVLLVIGGLFDSAAGMLQALLTATGSNQFQLTLRLAALVGVAAATVVGVAADGLRGMAVALLFIALLEVVAFHQLWRAHRRAAGLLS